MSNRIDNIANAIDYTSRYLFWVRFFVDHDFDTDPESSKKPSGNNTISLNFVKKTLNSLLLHIFNLEQGWATIFIPLFQSRESHLGLIQSQTMAFADQKCPAGHVLPLPDLEHN